MTTQTTNDYQIIEERSYEAAYGFRGTELIATHPRFGRIYTVSDRMRLGFDDSRRIIQRHGKGVGGVARRLGR